MHQQKVRGCHTLWLRDQLAEDWKEHDNTVVPVCQMKGQVIVSERQSYPCKSGLGASLVEDNAGSGVGSSWSSCVPTSSSCGLSLTSPIAFSLQHKTTNSCPVSQHYLKTSTILCIVSCILLQRAQFTILFSIIQKYNNKIFPIWAIA